jgi:hypothetical protein
MLKPLVGYYLSLWVDAGRIPQYFCNKNLGQAPHTLVRQVGLLVTKVEHCKWVRRSLWLRGAVRVSYR